jgi:hypothetical protein
MWAILIVPWPSRDASGAAPRIVPLSLPCRLAVKPLHHLRQSGAPSKFRACFRGLSAVISLDHSTPVAVVVVMIIVSVLVYPQHALYAANSDSTAHDPADRFGR